MSPYQHGEVYVTDDGAETDLDLGHYERFTGVPARGSDSISAGKIYSARAREGAPRRLSRRHRAGRPPRHRRHQGVHPRGRRRRRLRAVRDRRHGRRHRGPALPRGDPPARVRARPGSRRLCPSDAGALPGLGRRAEDQADPAFGARAARHRHPAGPAVVPRRSPDSAGRAAQDRAAMQRARGGRDLGARPRQHLRGADPLSRGGARHRAAQALRAAARGPARSRPLGGDLRASGAPRGRSDDRRGRQVHGPAGRVQVARRGAHPRRHRQPRAGQHALARRRDLRIRWRRAAPAGRERHPGAGRLRRARLPPARSRR